MHNRSVNFGLSATYAGIVVAMTALVSEPAFAFLRATNSVSWRAWDRSVAVGDLLLLLLGLWLFACSALSKVHWDRAQR